MFYPYSALIWFAKALQIKESADVTSNFLDLKGNQDKVSSLIFVFVTNLKNVDLEKLSFLFILLNVWEVLIYLF